MSGFDVSGRVTVVTGAGSGIGRALCLAFAQAGATVAALDLVVESARATVDVIRPTGGAAIAVGCDVRSPQQVASAFEAVDEAFGRVDVLVNNAGVASHTLPEDLGIDEWQDVLAVNLTGAFLCAQQAGRRMIPNGRGSIVNVSSIGGASGVGRGNFVYDISKAALLQLTRELAIEWARYSIRVNAILPCQVRTEALQRLIDDPQFDSDALVASFLRGIPLNRLGETEDIVGPVLFLASDAAALITGVALPVDGGNLAFNAGGTLRT